MKKFILNFTPTGMIPTKDMTPNVPTSADEIVKEVLDMAKLGANMIHLHARDPDGTPAYEKKIYGEMIEKIRSVNPDLVLGVSTSGRDFQEFSKRCEVLELKGRQKPDFASLTLSSLNFNKQASMNEPADIKALAKKMLDNGIRPEMEVFDLGMINYAKYLMKKELIAPPYYFNLILGNIACAQADIKHLGLMVSELPENSIWSAGGVGRWQLKMNAMALVAGGGVRVGIEDNIWFDDDRTKLATNTDLVKRIMSIAKALEMEPYSPKAAREVLGL